MHARASVEYDDNIFRVSEDFPKESDFVFRVSPRVVLEDRTQKLDYSVSWRVPYEKGIKTHQLNDFDQFLGGKFTYRFGEKTRVFGSESFSYLRSLSKVRDELELEDETTILEISKQTERNYRNNASLGISHQFTSDLSGALTLGHNFFDTTRDNRRQVQTFSASGNLSYAVDSKNRVGVGVSFTRQDFDDLPSSPGSETMIYRIFASWVYRFDETLSFTVRAGPTLFDNNQNAADQQVSMSSEVPFLEWYDGSLVVSPFESCTEQLPGQAPNARVIPSNRVFCNSANVRWIGPGTTLYNAIRDNAEAGPYTFQFDPGQAPGSDSEQRVDIFANAALTKRWSPRLSSSLSYQRSESGASGLSGSAILDSITATTSWRVTELWGASVRADWTKRTSVFPSTQVLREVEPWPGGPGPPDEIAGYTRRLLSRTLEEDVDTQRWGVGVRLARKISRHTSAALRVNYNRQKSKFGTSGETSDFNNFLVILGFSYHFDRIELW